jgi:hypothetical protein
MLPISALAPLGWRYLRLVPVLFGLSACSLRAPSLSVPSPGELTSRVWALLSSEDRAPIDFRRARLELEELGPDVDTILVSIAYDRSARPVTRANALLLLSERRSPAALTSLQWALFSAEHEVIREAAVLGLNRFVSESVEAQNAIRSAVADPSPRVRLNALQSLDVHDINAIRALLRTERHPLVRQIATQYLAISEARGAPLLADGQGVFRTSSLEDEPRLVLLPDSVDPQTGHVRGRLGLEEPGGAFLPLASDVEMDNHVLPAFLSPDRTVVVMEARQTIVLRDLEQREAIYLGNGVAPRPIPFTEAFVFLREVAANLPEDAADRQRFEVYRASFNGSLPERIGEMDVVVEPGEPGIPAAVRRLTIGESPEGWVLKIDGEVVFHAPHRGDAHERAVNG